MANKKLGTAASELRLPAKKTKGEKKPKWQAKTGGKKAKAAEVAETVEAAVETPALEAEQPEEAPSLADTTNTNEASKPATTLETTETPPTDEPAPTTNPEPITKKTKKLKVKADLKPKKLSMIKAALQVQQDGHRGTVGITPVVRLPTSTLYTALARSIKDLAKSSPFGKTERGSLRPLRLFTSKQKPPRTVIESISLVL